MNVYDNDKVKYANIFNQRGLDYHKAMLMLPRSRDNEFLNIANQVEYLSEMTIIDMPSGGNYLKAFLPKNVKVIPLETSSVFANIGDTQICDWSHFPFENNTIDVVFCCAAMHHVSSDDRIKFQQEVTRVLKTGGKLVVADVQKDSKMDTFLNGFVDKQNSMGHQGVFLDANFTKEFASENLIVLKDSIIDFPWILSTDVKMSMKYVQLLFGLDKASNKQIENYLKENLNLKLNSDNKLQIDWQLRYITFEKI